MAYRATRRNPRLSLTLRVAAVLFVALNIIDIIRVKHAQSSHPLPSDQGDLHKGTRLFITSTHWNNEAVLRQRWNDAIVELVKYFGPSNVYISIYESGSWDDTKGALTELESRLTDLEVGKTIVLDTTTHKDELERTPGPTEADWIETPRGKKELRRIPYLANLRNRALEPLHTLTTASPTPRKFDKILFLNDVYFTIPQLLSLLSTNNGHYAAACSLDFSRPPYYYDTFALRDSGTSEVPLMQRWPYFRSRRSRNAMKANSDAVPVSSCWNGMVLMDTEPFYDKLSPLHFRGVTDRLASSHVEGSECCLIHADNPYTPARGVFLNPRVRVGYNEPAFLAVNPDFDHPTSSDTTTATATETHGSGSTGSWLSTWDIFTGLWKNRILRWTTTSWFQRHMITGRVKAFEKGHPGAKGENGAGCLVDEMQVLVENGWAHV